MVSRRGDRQAFDRATEYASAEEFCRIFEEDMTSLYWLALVLTADECKAEQCFVAGLEECVEGNAVFKEWARSWSKRVMIKKAIQLIAPAPGVTNGPPATRSKSIQTLRATAALKALEHVEMFDRFVFVISVLENYSDRDCAALLGCAPANVAKARNRAFQGVRRTSAESVRPDGFRLPSADVSND